MKKVAESIEILEEIKTGVITDDEGNEETYEYKEVLVKDKEGDVLETFRVGTNVETDQDFFSSTGVKLGVSTWITND